MAPGSLSHFAFLEHMDSARGDGLLVAHGLGSPLDRAQGPKPRPPGKESERLWLCPQLGSQLLRLGPVQTLLPYAPSPEDRCETGEGLSLPHSCELG